ncbi:MAG: OB-fold domain-containing protein [Dehalococcoidales bacterium]|nr:OB-fold domain-containing protein [Dehalococcoidales bacterium]
MVGITSFGVHLPVYRLRREEIGRMWGRAGGEGARAVAGYDEDPITMAVAAVLDCLKRTGGEADRLFLATTTSPYREKQAAAVVASAADLREDCHTADFSGSLRASSSALMAALDAVSAGAGKSAIVVASDMRAGAAKGSLEATLGDGAAALTVGTENVVAELEGSYSVYSDFTDYWRLDEDRFLRSAEGRFIDEAGYFPIMERVIGGLLDRYGLKSGDFSRIVYYASDSRQHGALARRLRLEKEKVQPPLYDAVGNTGTAAVLLMLGAALEQAKAGERILVVGYGDGADAFIFRVTGEIEKFRRIPLVSDKLVGKVFVSYGQYLTWRGIIPVETQTLPERPPLSLPARFRERRAISALYGVKCRRCGTPQFSPLGQNIRVCVKCQAKDEFEPYRFSDKRGTLFTYSVDSLMPTLNPPGVNGVVDFEGGGRLVCELTDCIVENLKVGMPVEMTFRRMFVNRGIISYFWKARPVAPA